MVYEAVVNRGEIMIKIRDFDIWMKPCKCGYDSGRVSKKSSSKCWKCGKQLYRDFSDRALIVNRYKYEES
jgi:hypothetical protein